MTPERWRQIEDLYNLASDRGPEVLANADPEIRREVEALPGQEPGENIFDRPAFDLLNSASQAAVTAGSQWGP